MFVHFPLSWLLLSSQLLAFVACLEPITVGVFGGVGGIIAGYFGWNTIKCMTQECCHQRNDKYLIDLKMDQWIHYDVPWLSHNVSRRLHGQPLAEAIVTKYIKLHLRDDNPSKALVLSFHGWTGSGKNHLSKIIAQTLYRQYNRVERSEFVNLLVATNLNFDANDNYNEARNFLKNNITRGVKKCKRALFIIDEVDKMPSGFIDTVKPFLDYHPEVDGVDYRKAIFLFLSNTGGNLIAQVAYDFWKNGKRREEMTMKDIEPLIISGAFNEVGGLHKSDVIAKHLVDAFVPFLPLQKSHVKLCVQDYLRKRFEEKNDHNYNNQGDDFYEKVADELEFYPPDIKLYSKSGCKKVERKVDVLIDL